MKLRRDRRTREVVLYGKPGCHLCEEAERLLRQLARRYPMHINKVDITTDRETFRAYDIRIPVITVDGDRTVEAPVREEDLRWALQ